MSDELIKVPVFLAAEADDSGIMPMCGFCTEVACETSDMECSESCGQSCGSQCKVAECSQGCNICERSCQSTCQGGCQGCEGCQTTCEGSSQGPTTTGTITSITSTATTITIRYTRIPKADWYQVVYKEGSSGALQYIANGTSLTRTIKGLTPRTSYTVNYRGASDAYGFGPLMNPGKTISTNAAVPASFSIIEKGTTSIMLWVSVGSSTEFRIYCTTPAGRVIHDETVTKTSDFEHPITGLIPHTLYKVNVHYDVGNAWCGTEDFTTASDRPEDWEWWSTVERSEPIQLSADEWNAFCGRINRFRTYKGLEAYGAFIEAAPGMDISAAIVNHGVWAVGAMSDGALALEVKRGDRITEHFFNSLKDYLNSV